MKKKIVIFIFFIVLIVGISLLLPKTTKETYAALQDGILEQLKLGATTGWSAGDSGLFITDEGDYRYVGAEVDNFVRFNNDLYRIIGIFNDNTHGVEGEE